MMNMLGQLMHRLTQWLKAKPQDRPRDLVEFERSNQRLARSSEALERGADELGRMIARMEAHKPVRAKKQKIGQK
jgi:hypothetical protein